jgi:thioredoxin-related protein
MRAVAAVLAAFLLAGAGPAGAATSPEKPRPEPYTLPQWFKPSFLDFRQDVAEARQRGRHVMIFLHLDACPYCARLLQENFVGGDNHDFMREHFDVIAINVRGSLEVRWIDGATYSEKRLAEHLSIRGTPTIIFLDDDAKMVLRIAGYREPRALRAALNHVQSRSYRSRPFDDKAGNQTRVR